MGPRVAAPLMLQAARIEDVDAMVTGAERWAEARIGARWSDAGIMNVLLASVAERTREIGIRKATGARDRDILMQFLAESVAITGAGALIGVALGLTIAFAVVISVVIGLAFGLYPARRAARLSPIDAIRHE